MRDIPEVDYGLDLRLAEACDALTKILRTLESAQNVRLPSGRRESVIEMLKRSQPKARRAATLMTELRQGYEREQRAADRALDRAINLGRY